MIIELFGLPGSGKTTFTQQNRNYFCLGYQKINFINKTMVIIKYPLVWLWFKEVLKESFKINSWFLFKFKISLVLQTFYLFDRAKKMEKSEKDVIIDEGFLQRILSIYETKKSYHFFQKIIKKIKIKKVYIIELNKNFNFKRYKEKSNNRAKLGQNYLNNWFKIVQDNYLAIIKALDVLEIDYKIINNENE